MARSGTSLAALRLFASLTDVLARSHQHHASAGRCGLPQERTVATFALGGSLRCLNIVKLQGFDRDHSQLSAGHSLLSGPTQLHRHSRQHCLNAGEGIWTMIGLKKNAQQLGAGPANLTIGSAPWDPRSLWVFLPLCKLAFGLTA